MIMVFMTTKSFIIKFIFLLFQKIILKNIIFLFYQLFGNKNQLYYNNTNLIILVFLICIYRYIQFKRLMIYYN